MTLSGTKFPYAMAVLGLILIVATFRAGNVKAQLTTHPANSMWIDPGNLSFARGNGSVGTMFNLTVWVSTNESSYTWQAGIHFDHSLFQVTDVGLTAGTTSEFFQNHTTVTGQIVIDNASGEVLYGETLLSNDSAAAGNGSLMWTTFEIIDAPNSTSTSSGIFSLDFGDESYVLNYDLYEMNLTGRFGAGYSFDYFGDTIPPTIVSVTQFPANGSVLSNQNVTVSANVTDDFGGSGVANVTLSYSTNNVTFTNETMNLNMVTQFWVGAIPGYAVGTTVYYLIYASDNAGNSAELNDTEHLTYTVVVSEFAQPLLTLLLPAMATSVLIMRKKAKRKAKLPFQ